MKNYAATPIEVHPVRSEADLGHAAALFREYAAGLPFTLDFQDFEAEVGALPGRYAEPRGGIWLATVRVEGESTARLAGCAALRPLESDVGELKRMFVRDALRGLGAGRGLANAVIRGARERGYRLLRLDTVGRMTAANSLYRGLGFREIAPYCHNPLADALYFERLL